MDSPYINDIDLQPPSPSDAQATFESYDFNGTSYAQQSPNSYNGSYNNSPYSAHSELSFGPDDNLNAINGSGAFGLFEDESSLHPNSSSAANSGALGLREYDPSDFDAPHSGSSLLMFDNDYMTPYETHLPPSMSHHGQDHRVSYDYSSPASSNGGDSGNDDARSRASSVSSNPHNHHTLSSPPPPHMSPSPRLGVAQNLENLSFNSPNWGTVPLPQQHSDNHNNNASNINFRDNKPQSPPRLLMPDSSLAQPPPTINAPDGDGHHGPSLNIVPATPISGMANSSQVPFQNTLEAVSQEPTASWDEEPSTSGFQFPQQRGSGLHSQGILNPAGGSPAHHRRELSEDNTAPNAHHNSGNDGNKGTLTNGFLFPSNMSTPGSGPSNLNLNGGHAARLRSKSDTALEPPNWDHTAFGGGAGRSGSAVVDDHHQQQHQHHQNSHQGAGGEHHHQGPGSGHLTPSFNFATLPAHPNASPSASPHLNSTHLPAPSDNELSSQHNNNNNNNNYLSPEMSNLRRSRSDTGGRPGHIRQSRSEDLRGVGLGSGVGLGGESFAMGSAGQGFGLGGSSHMGGHHGHGHSHSFSHTQGGVGSSGAGSSFLYPPTSQQEFLQRQQQQYLTPSGMVGMGMGLGLGGEGLPSMGGHGRHYRRASSGSRSERGISTFNGNLSVDDPSLGGGLGIGGGGWSGTNSARASPYPSPNVSPRVRYEELPGGGLDVGGLGVGSSPAMGGVSLPSVSAMGGNGAGMNGNGGSVVGLATVGGVVAPAVPPGVQVPVTVSKPNVTTGRTANASHKRRKQEATFVCPVPGCGSTFTRSFNLKGHIRSHNEEKPFQCHWPGCGKGFARQHDCKRHEQLHTNYRPFTCDGCSKQFARMDALNRHLRSEGGAECQRTLESNGNLPLGVGGGGTGKAGVTKTEEGWSSPVGVAL